MSEGVMMRTRAVVFVAVLLGVSLAPVLGESSRSARSPGSTPPRARGPEIHRLPAAFEPNLGQADPGADFLVRCRGHLALLCGRDLVLPLPGRAGSGARIVRLALPPSESRPRLVAGRRLPGVCHYLRGQDRSRWVRHVPRHASVACRSATMGVDVVYRDRDGRLRFDLMLRPGADPRGLRYRITGVDRIHVDSCGDLILEIPDRELRITAPVAYQRIDGGKIPVEARWVVRDGSTAAIEVGRYDASRVLVVDPTLVYSTFLQSEVHEYMEAVDVDAKGQAYVLGHTVSPDFPITDGAYDEENEDRGGGSYAEDVFVTKFTAQGSSLVYSTYLGGISRDWAEDLAVDSSERAHVLVRTWSNNYPTTSGAYETTNANHPGDVAALTKLNASGSDLEYSTLIHLGRAAAVGLTSKGEACVGTRATGSCSALKLDTKGTKALWITTIDTQSSDHVGIIDLAIASDDAVCLVGATSSEKLPTTTGAFQTSHAGGGDSFITKIDSKGVVVFTSYLGGKDSDVLLSGGVDANGHIYAGGYTLSSDYPTTTGAHQGTKPSQDSYFSCCLTKIKADGSKILYSTFLGGKQIDKAFGIAVHWSGTVYMTGQAGSTDFPVTQDAYQPNRRTAGSYDVFFSKFDHEGKLAYSTYFGSNKQEIGRAIVAQADGTCVVSGDVDNEHTFPTLNPYQGPSSNTSYDCFVFKFSDSLPKTPVAIATESLPGWTRGVAYSRALAATGGQSPMAWSLKSGSLPAGLSLAPSGAIAGTPTTAGTATFTVAVTDDYGIVTERELMLQINEPPQILSGPPAWTVGQGMDGSILTSGGTPPFAWTKTAGDLPPGLALGDGSVTGTPTDAGSWTCTLRLVDAAAAQATASIQVGINAVPTFSTTTLPPATETRPYGETIGMDDGTPPFTWAFVSGSFPTKGGLGAATGTLDGATKTDGEYRFTVRATDSTGATCQGELTLVVNPFPEILTESLPMGAAGRPYLSTLSGQGGTPETIWSVADSLPAGLALTSGAIRGTPSAATTGTASIRYEDFLGARAEKDLSLVIADRGDLTSGKVKLKLEQEDEPIARYLELLKDSRLTASIKFSEKVAAQTVVQLLDGSGAAVDFSSLLKVKSKSIKIGNLPIPETGRYFLLVEPPEGFAGKVTLSVSVVAAKKWAGVESLVAGGHKTLSFEALPGSILKLKMKPEKGSPSRPLVVTVKDASGTDLLLATDIKVKSNGSLKLKLSTPLPGGVFSVEIRDDVGGSFTWSVKLGSPRGYAVSMPDLPSGE
jgi:Putative Ig domain